MAGQDAEVVEVGPDDDTCLADVISDFVLIEVAAEGEDNLLRACRRYEGERPWQCIDQRALRHRPV